MQERLQNHDERIVRLEAAVQHIRDVVKRNHSSSMRRINEVQEDVRDRIMEQTKVFSEADYSLEKKIDANHASMKSSWQETNIQLQETNKTLNKINDKLNIHTFVFGVAATIATVVLAAFAKSMFDLFVN